MRPKELSRKAVLGSLEITRLPLTAAERALGKTERNWAPTIIVDRFQARVKEIAGTVLRDETLRADAKLQNAALDERLRASIAEDTADRVRAEAKRATSARRETLAETSG
jgi:hypothetical protein